MALSTQETADLAALRAADIALATGQNVVSVTYNGKRTDFGKGDKARIVQLIDKLEAQACAPTGQYRRTRGAIGVRF